MVGLGHRAQFVGYVAIEIITDVCIHANGLGPRRRCSENRITQKWEIAPKRLLKSVEGPWPHYTSLPSKVLSIFSARTNHRLYTQLDIHTRQLISLRTHLVTSYILRGLTT